ncbi:MAG TPA: DNA internalization-related competence protein ComEC/Rec2, partial [Candidatus Limnocylindria bacterium]|nr:DNA internalization-related competence protein ComEC/Rec2 [Candidatus Limnocylindria bacterium]
GAARRQACGLVRLTIRQPTRRWRYGERLRVETRLRAPRNFENPGGFDYVGHLARQGVRVTASVWNGGELERLPGRTRGLRARLERWRERLAAAMAAAVPPPEGAVLQALIVGDEEGIDAELREAFTRAGVVHVLSISGLHVGLVAAAGFWLARRLLGRSERLLLAVDVERLAALGSLGPVALYTALAGLGVATLRSAIMVAAAVLAGLLGRRADVLRTLALAALVLALAWPGTPLEIAFQLSFASVAAIVCGMRRLAPAAPAYSWHARLRAAVLVSPCALVGTAPLTAFHFHQVSLVGVIANPLAIPIFGSAVVILGLMGAVVEPLVPGAAAALFRAAGLVLRPGIALVRALAKPAWAAVDVPIPSLLELALVYGLLSGLLWLPRRGARALVLVALAGLVVDAAWWANERFLAQRLRVSFLDVGQGDAAVIELSGGRVLVVDAGGFPGGDFDTGAAVVGPFLWARKILRVDALAMTHAHPDHSGGLPYLLAHFRPREFWWTGVPGEGVEWERLEGALAGSGSRVRVLTAGAPLPALAGATEVLHPPDDGGYASLNDSSLTLRVRAGAAAVLLTGDIEARAEERLLLAPAPLAAAVLKVPHHGSRTSSTPRFVDAVAPRVAVVSVGADNRYRLPSPEVEARYRARGTCVLRTDRCGAITVTIDGARLAVRARRPGCACPSTPPG